MRRLAMSSELRTLRDLIIFAEAAGAVVRSPQRLEALDHTLDLLIARFAATPIRSSDDAALKVWMVRHTCEGGIDFDGVARDCLNQIDWFISSTRHFTLR